MGSLITRQPRRPRAQDCVLAIDLWILLAATLLLAAYLLKRASIGRWSGVLMLGAYCLYIGSLVLV